MRARLRRAALLFVLISVLLSAAFATAILGTAWSQQRRASRLLAVVKELRPGSTTEHQAREALKPFSRYEIVYEQSRPDKPLKTAQYEFLNVPPWRVGMLPLTFLRWTRFAVDITYRHGMVTQLTVGEMQEEHLGYPHPDAATVRIYSVHDEAGTKLLPDEFNGYSLHLQETGGVDENGHWSGFKCCEQVFNQLDERATPEQRSQALNFNLSCFSSIRPCDEPRKIRPPLR